MQIPSLFLISHLLCNVQTSVQINMYPKTKLNWLALPGETIILTPKSTYFITVNPDQIPNVQTNLTANAQVNLTKNVQAT